MRFSAPSWLLAGLLTGVVLVALWRWHDVRQQAALARFVAAHLRLKLTGSVSAVGRFVQRALLLGSVCSLFAALAGPQLGYHWVQISRRGNEVIFALDTSRSMLTPDVKPDRLTRAKLAIDDMARQLEGDGIGIVAFAGSAFMVCPLTFDYGAFHQSLDAIDAHTIARGGTNIASAIVTAREALRRRPGSDRILILLTDGENLEGDDLAAAKEASSQDGLKIYTVGVGTTEGELIPLPADMGGGFVKDEAGELVKSHLDEHGLQAIASATGGTYVRLGHQGEDFETFLRTVFAAVSKHDLRFRQQRIYTERYQWPLAASVGMLLASLMMGTRRGRRSDKAAAVTLVLVVVVMFVPVRSQGADQAADIKAPRKQYNVGTSAYRAGQFSKATQAFQQSIKAAPASDARRLADQEDAYYNLGNALYREGQQSEKSAPQEALQKWTAAVKAYDTALQLHADDADSRYNRDFVQRKIDALQQPPKQGGGGGGGRGNGGCQGRGQGQAPPQGRGQPPGRTPPQQQGQPSPEQTPPPQQGQTPPGQPPQPQQGQTPPGQPPQPQQGQPPPGQTPPQQQGQLPPGQTPPLGQPTQPPPAQQVGSPSSGADRRAPAQMSADEARELLDSAKSDEHHSLPVPTGPRDPKDPDKPYKNW